MTKDLIQGFEADEGASRLLHSLRDDFRAPGNSRRIASRIELDSSRSRAMPIAPQYGK
jgi:hypothetical protein